MRDLWRLNPLNTWLGTCPSCRTTQRVVMMMYGPEAFCEMCGWSGLRFRLWRWVVRPFHTVGYLLWRWRNAREVRS